MRKPVPWETMPSVLNLRQLRICLTILLVMFWPFFFASAIYVGLTSDCDSDSCDSPHN
jgi:hypothetical protein